MDKPIVSWFKNPHEHRNYWLRYGLMIMHMQGKIRYEELPLDACTRFGFSDEVAMHVHRHTSVIAVRCKNMCIRAIIDSEDSFFFLTDLIKYCDLYFISGFNRKFFTDGGFEQPYKWLKPHEVDWYKFRADWLWDAFGRDFKKVLPFVPIPPSLSWRGPGLIEGVARNRMHRLLIKFNSTQDWTFAYIDFERRYKELLRLRDRRVRFDVVLQDTLWGWPRHRIALHRRLSELDVLGYAIHSTLSYSEPVPMDGSLSAPATLAGFPMRNGRIVNYEEMLAASRLGVFATGFHFGWRSIFSFALLVGIPVVSDRLLLEPWFDMGEFSILWNDDGEWDGLVDLVAGIDDDERSRVGGINQKVFDSRMAPERVAEYFLSRVLPFCA